MLLFISIGGDNYKYFKTLRHWKHSKEDAEGNIDF